MRNNSHWELNKVHRAYIFWYSSSHMHHLCKSVKLCFSMSFLLALFHDFFFFLVNPKIYFLKFCGVYCNEVSLKTVKVLLNTMSLTTVWQLNHASKLHVRGTVIPKGLVTGLQVGLPANKSLNTLYRTWFYEN